MVKTMNPNNVVIIGFLWGLISIIPYSYINNSDLLIRKFLLTFLGLPTYIAIALGFQFSFVFIGAPIMGIVIIFIFRKYFIKNNNNQRG